MLISLDIASSRVAVFASRFQRFVIHILLILLILQQTSIAPGEVIVVAKKVADFLSIYPSTGFRYFGGYVGEISNGGDKVPPLFLSPLSPLTH